MKEDRWPKVCLREEIRGIINRNPSQWGREFKQALVELGDGRIVGAIWKESDWREVLILLGEGLKRKEEQDTQGDWVKVDKSSFCKFYGEIKKTVDREEYWDKKGINGEMKEEWARLRCGNIGKVGKKGYEDWRCRICGKKDESINRIWMCKDARELLKDEWVRGVDEWREGKIGEELSSRLLRQLQGDPIPALCEYLRAFETSAKKIRDAKEKQ